LKRNTASGKGLTFFPPRQSFQQDPRAVNQELVQHRSFPLLTGRRAARRLGTIPEGCPAICINSPTLDAILDYSGERLDAETGGFLIGQRCQDRYTNRQFLDIEHFLPASSTSSGFDSLTFTHDTWSRLHRDIDRQYAGSQILGWHHTHPGFGIFLSRHDEFIHRNFFDSPWHVALVVDPCAGEFGFFQWLGDDLVNTGFLLVSGQHKSSRQTA
jgi:proteasome lid subunit RPN8/RPN11